MRMFFNIICLIICCVSLYITRKNYIEIKERKIEQIKWTSTNSENLKIGYTVNGVDHLATSDDDIYHDQSDFIEILDIYKHEPSTVELNPTLRVHNEDVSINQYFISEYIETENFNFLLMKDLYCSNNSLAKELIEKYKITSNNVTCF